MNFDEFQRAVEDIARAQGASDVGSLALRLAGHVGSVAEDCRSNVGAAATRLGDVLQSTAALAGKLGVSLGEIATSAIVKSRNRWLPPVGDHELLDDRYDATEQLPRTFAVTFSSYVKDDTHHAVMHLGLDPVGDPLRDLAYIADGYRWHDALHLAYAAILGWSPVLRALLGRKRRSTPVVDAIEDGGRAIVIEEGITAYIFAVAHERSFFEGVDHIESKVLERLLDMTSGLEVRSRSGYEWERAVLTGFEVWRAVCLFDGGVVKGDLRARTLEFLHPDLPTDGLVIALKDNPRAQDRKVAVGRGP